MRTPRSDLHGDVVGTGCTRQTRGRWNQPQSPRMTRCARGARGGRHTPVTDARHAPAAPRRRAALLEPLVVRAVAVVCLKLVAIVVMPLIVVVPLAPDPRLKYVVAFLSPKFAGRRRRTAQRRRVAGAGAIRRARSGRRPLELAMASQLYSVLVSVAVHVHVGACACRCWRRCWRWSAVTKVMARGMPAHPRVMLHSRCW